MHSLKYKNYFIFTENLSNFGGAQLYVLRRAKYLANQGLIVKLITLQHSCEDFILKEKFKSFPILYLSQFNKPITFFSDKAINNILCTVSLFLQDYENGIIETNSLQEAVWGELIASKLNLKHFIYLLAEQKVSRYLFYPRINFFKFKLLRGEFFGCSDYSLSLIFNGNYECLSNCFVNIPFDPDELSDTTYPSIKQLHIDTNSFVIGTITRLEKKYLEVFIKSCIQLAQKLSNKNFTILVVGGSHDKNLLNSLNEKYAKVNLSHPNISIIFTGYITELGKDFFNLLDVFVGMGTASINAISQGVATLNIDPRSNLSSGIFGIDTKNFAYSTVGKFYEIDDMLEKLVLNDELLQNAKSKGKEVFMNQYLIDSCFQKLNYLLNLSDTEKLYFQFSISIFNRIIDFGYFILLLIKRKFYNLFFIYFLCTIY